MHEVAERGYLKGINIICGAVMGVCGWLNVITYYMMVKVSEVYTAHTTHPMYGVQRHMYTLEL